MGSYRCIKFTQHDATQEVSDPYFYQDVSFGTKLLKLDSGEPIEMPNVVRTV